MNDLISRKEVEREIKGYFKMIIDNTDDDIDCMLDYNKNLCDAIRGIPTAYDVDKVVEGLELENKRLKTLKNNCIALCDHEVIGIENKAYDYAIKIVRNGGKNE